MIYRSPLLGRRVMSTAVVMYDVTMVKPVMLKMCSSTHSEAVKEITTRLWVIAVLNKESFVFEVILVSE